MINIAIFASGSGTNAEEIIRYFALSEKYKVALVFSNRPNPIARKRVFWNGRNDWVCLLKSWRKRT